MHDLTRRQDDSFLTFAHTLTEWEWAAPSLCRGWMNKDVLAHLVLGLRLPVRHLDIALALGHSDVLRPDVTDAVLTVETRIPNPFHPAAARARGLSLRTTDTTWSPRGDPALDVIGNAESLISVLAGRMPPRRRARGTGALNGSPPVAARSPREGDSDHRSNPEVCLMLISD